MIVFCFHTLCRFSCCNVVKLSHLGYHKDYFEIEIVKSKTDQTKKGQNAFLVKSEGIYDPHMLLCLYLQIISQTGDDFFLFPPLYYSSDDRTWKVPMGKMLSYSAANQSFKKFAKKFGLDPTKFSLHSPRIGGTTSLFQNNVPKRIINKMGRWKSTKTKYIYGRDKNRYIVNQLLKQPKL